MHTIVRAFYDKQLYREIYTTWKFRSILTFLIVLAAINTIAIAALWLPKVSGNTTYQTLLGFLHTDDRNAIVKLLNQAPPTWEIRRDSGLVLRDEAKQPVASFSMLPFVVYDASSTMLTTERIMSAYVYLTPQHVYTRATTANAPTQHDPRTVLTNNAKVMQLSILRTPDHRFSKAQVFIDSIMVKQYTMADIRKLTMLFTVIACLAAPGLIIAGIGMSMVQLAFVALFVALTMFVLSRIRKQKLTFARLYPVSIAVQTWSVAIGLLIAIFGLPLAFLKTFAWVIFGCVVVVKFLGEQTNTAEEHPETK